MSTMMFCFWLLVAAVGFSGGWILVELFLMDRFERRQRREAEQVKRLRREIRHQLLEGFSIAEISRNLNLSLVIVQHEQALAGCQWIGE